MKSSEQNEYFSQEQPGSSQTSFKEHNDDSPLPPESTTAAIQGLLRPPLNVQTPRSRSPSIICTDPGGNDTPHPTDDDEWEKALSEHSFVSLETVYDYGFEKESQRKPASPNSPHAPPLPLQPSQLSNNSTHPEADRNSSIVRWLGNVIRGSMETCNTSENVNSKTNEGPKFLPIDRLRANITKPAIRRILELEIQQSSDPELNQQSSLEKIGDGGQASVGKIKIHPAHHNFKPTKPSIQGQGIDTNPSFALKTLYSKDREEFEKEVEVLERFSGKNAGHPHLIRLLLTYRHGKSFHMLFPCADGNLMQFWERAPPAVRTDGKCAQWLITQCYGLVEGLGEIHGKLVSGVDEVTGNEDEKNAGRHGDIKPENILWFEKTEEGDDHLVISDFGLARFHRLRSRSKGEMAGFSPTYKAPEGEIPGPVSPRYDMWSLGCVLLEFLTWYMLGFEAVKITFSDNRIGDETHKVLREDKFYLLDRNDDKNAKPQGRLKPSVIKTAQTLCTNF
ncbi:kinase-like domain-containing protein [Podospora didyma]|uniref:Kinase-like domain-containing protein n=1 Tax=Podospora didyma TaxID=330526 RepID=A0AAE0NC81_9PEZI|nr:kinase-like domain-containing protein [Podospora didyma]